LELNHRDHVARVTIVYYGPAAGGKTTNLQVLHARARPEHRGELVSVNSSQGRTILFDLLPVNGLGLAGWELRLRLLAVPGQSAYAAARRLSIRGADAIVFVANSASDRWYENPASLRELTDNLRAQEIDPQALPMVLQYNKRDLPEIMPVAAMDQGLNPRGWPAVPAVASRGEGVFETLSAMLRVVVSDLAQKYRTLALPAGVSPEDWTRESLQRAFGTPAATRPPASRAPGGARAAPPGRRVVHAADEIQQAASGRPDERLVESYAQASVALGQAVEDLRQQRDAALRRAEDLRYALGAVETLASGQEPEAGIAGLLERMASAGRSRRASLLAPGPAGSLRKVATLTADPDVFAGTPRGAQIIGRHLLVLSAHAVNDPATPAELRAVMNSAVPPVHGVASVPLRYGDKVHAVFLLYYSAADPMLTTDELGHLGWLGRGLSASLLARRAQSRANGGADAGRKALALEIALRALERGSGRLPHVGRQAQAVRSLARGAPALQVESLDPVFEDLRQTGAEVVVEPGLTVRGEICLLHLALEALVELASGGNGRALVAAQREQGHVLISVSGPLLQGAPASSDVRWRLAGAVAELHSAVLASTSWIGRPALTLRLRG
jgi:signal recognition particle receptor subunit beta